ncbi:MAG: hypothetical protein J2P18_13175 [Nocardia sp.]|nr:hypothetical protein [Nocardia sp.]
MIVTTWTKVEVRALRDAALRRTQEEFAECLGFKVETIQKWEQKATQERPVKGRSAEALDTALGQLESAQRERFWSELARTKTHSIQTPTVVTAFTDAGKDAREVEEVRRRDLGKLAAVAGAAILLPNSPTHIGKADVRRLLAGVDALERADQEHGGAGLVEYTTDRLDAVKGILDRGVYDSRTGTEFTSAAGELAVLSGWLAYDADQHGQARRCYADAMALGAEADDPDLLAHTCLNLSNQASSLARLPAGGGSPHKALQLNDRARDLMRGRPAGRIHALIGLRDAQAYALLGDRSAFGRSIATAWRELEHALQFEPLEDVPQWLRFVTSSEVADSEARGFADVGDLTRAVDLYATAVEHPAGRRNTVLVRACSAATRARAGDTAGALEHGMSALAGLSEVSSIRTLTRLRPVRVAVADIPAGEQFRDRFDALTGKAMQ